MSTVVSTRVSDDVLAKIQQLAESHERSRAWVVNRLVEDAVRRVTELEAFLQEGTDAIERGDFHTQEEMELWAASLGEERKKAA
jgi:predicted transcriptional regulator